MTEQLPIAIMVNEALMAQFTKLKSVTNKLEAQFNFQTLTANWYGEEDNILQITLSLETASSFMWQKQQAHIGLVTEYADDVFSIHNNENNMMECFIALTTSEVSLLAQQEKLLPGFIQTKTLKVLNLIAKQLGFPAV